MKRALVTTVLAAFLFCSTQEKEHAPVAESLQRPHVLLITIDTLRADHLSCYGYGATRTPNIDSLATDGVQFDQAIAQAPLTLPSHASLLTGTHPIYHGVRDNSGFVLPEPLTTLAEVLSSNGYATGAVVGSYVLDSRFGLGQGFDFYFDNFKDAMPGAGGYLDMEISERPAGEVLSVAKDWMDSPRGKPVFLWVHLFDPHAPYAPPRPYPAADPYDQEILYVDEALGGFLNFLRARGLYHESLIILAADHGEGLGEHGEDTHGMFLYDSTLRVPLIFKLPMEEHAGRRIEEQVRLTDVMPTVLEIAGAGSPADLQGVSLVQGMAGAAIPELPAFSEALLPLLNYGWSDISSLRTRGYKLIEAPSPELYDLSRDPGEQDNLYLESPETAVLAARKTDLERQLTGVASAAAFRTPDPETVQRLQSLGYVSGTRTGSSETEPDPIRAVRSRLGPRPADPKNKIAIFNRIRRAQSSASSGHFEEALRILEAVHSEDPSVFMAHSISALAQLQLNRVNEALGHLNEAIRLRPEDPGARVYHGLANARSGQFARAAASFEKALQLDPENEAAANNLAAMYLQQQRFDQAIDILNRITRRHPDDLVALVNLGTAHLQEGNHSQAVATFRKAIQRDSSIPELHNNLGLAYKSLGKLGEATTSFLEAIQLRPDYRNAFVNLAEVYRLRGMSNEAQAALDRARQLESRR